MARNTPLDLDGDGLEDIPWYYFETAQDEDPSHLAFWAARADGFQWSYVGYTDNVWEPVGAGDFANDDPAIDALFVDETTNSYGFWDINGGAVERWVFLGTAGQGWSVLRDYGLDITGDGTDDVLFVNAFSGEFGYWDVDDGAVSRWVSLGATASYQNPTSGSYWDIAGGGDFTGDGRADLFWRDAVSGATGLWRTEESGSATWVGLPTVTGGWLPGYTDADVNGDGNTDILWTLRQNPGEGAGDAVGFWDLDSGGADWTYVGEAPAGWSVIGAGDYTGDGAADILLGNASTGDIGYWELDAGGVYAGWVYVGNDAPGDGWTVFGTGV